MKRAIMFADPILSGLIASIAAVRPRTLSSWPASPGESTRSGLSAISNPIKKDQPDGRQLKKECFSRRLSALASRSLAHLWPAHRCCLRETLFHLVPDIMLQPPGASYALGRRAPHLQAPTLLTRVVCAECSCSHRSSMWRCRVENFAAGASQDRGWHVLQRQLDGAAACASIGRRLLRAHHTTRGAAVADGGAEGRRSQTTSWSMPAAETSWGGPRTPVVGVGTMLTVGGARTGSCDG